MEEDAVKAAGVEENQTAGVAVNGDMDRSIQIRKSISEDQGLGENYGPWMIAKKPTRRVVKQKEMIKSADIYRKENNSRLEKDGDIKGGVAGNTRFNVLYDLEREIDEEGIEKGDGLENRPTEASNRAGPSGEKSPSSSKKNFGSATGVMGRRNNSKAKVTATNYKAQLEKAQPKETYLCEAQNRFDTIEAEMEKEAGGLPRPIRVAAEAEHTVVRGVNKGKKIERKVVSNFAE